MYIGAYEGLVHTFVHPPGRHYHGLDGFCDVQFPDDPVQDPANPVVREDRHAALVMTELVAKYPGATRTFCGLGGSVVTLVSVAKILVFKLRSRYGVFRGGKSARMCV